MGSTKASVAIVCGCVVAVIALTGAAYACNGGADVVNAFSVAIVIVVSDAAACTWIVYRRPIPDRNRLEVPVDSDVARAMAELDREFPGVCEYWRSM